VTNPNLLDSLYTYAWFVTFGLSFAFYLALSRSQYSNVARELAVERLQ
jgi:cytosine/uracil/thiamine/allantoin permease